MIERKGIQRMSPQRSPGTGAAICASDNRLLQPKVLFASRRVRCLGRCLNSRSTSCTGQSRLFWCCCRCTPLGRSFRRCRKSCKRFRNYEYESANTANKFPIMHRRGRWYCRTAVLEKSSSLRLTGNIRRLPARW